MSIIIVVTFDEIENRPTEENYAWNPNTWTCKYEKFV